MTANRVFQGALVAFGFVCTYVVASSGRSDDPMRAPQRIIASEIVVRSATGSAEITIGALDELAGGLGIRIVDDSKKTRMYLGLIPANASQPVILLCDSSGRPRVNIESGIDGSAIFSGRSSSGLSQFDIVGSESGTGIELFEDGRKRIRLFAGTGANKRQISAMGTTSQPASGDGDTGHIVIYGDNGSRVEEYP